jgi:hypothetical protein
MPIVQVSRATSGTSIVAWFVKSGARTRFQHDIVVGLRSPDREDMRLFATIVTTATR